MQFSLVAIASLFASAEAAHLWSKPAVKLIKTKQAVATNYTWTVTGWSAGCARAGCYYGIFLNYLSRTINIANSIFQTSI